MTVYSIEIHYNPSLSRPIKFFDLPTWFERRSERWHLRWRKKIVYYQTLPSLNIFLATYLQNSPSKCGLCSVSSAINCKIIIYHLVTWASPALVLTFAQGFAPRNSKRLRVHHHAGRVSVMSALRFGISVLKAPPKSWGYIVEVPFCWSVTFS